MIKVAISSGTGKMGQALLESVDHHPHFELTAVIVSAANPTLTKEVGTLIGINAFPFKPTDDLSKVIAHFDVLIDFTTPQATLDHLTICQQHRKKVVIGTTGFNNAQKAQIKKISQQIPIVFSANMSVGMNVCFALIEQSVKLLKNIADVEIIEAHHRHKKDAPSGSALTMGEIIAQTLNLDLDKVARFDNKSRDGQQTIGFSSIRAGDMVGDHTVMFACEGERIEITHRASSRQAFAQGALRAAQWLQDKEEGLYSMKEVLGIV